MGCVMMRVCNLDTCPVGIATQNPELRKRFPGKPEYVVNFMRFIAQELREYMAKLGVRTRGLSWWAAVTCCRCASTAGDQAGGHGGSEPCCWTIPGRRAARIPTSIPKDVYDFQLEDTVDESMLLEKLGKALKKGEPMHIELKVSSTDRTFGTIFGSEITRLYGSSLP